MFYKRKIKELESTIECIRHSLGLIRDENTLLNQKVKNLELEVFRLKYPPIYKIGQSISLKVNETDDWVIINEPYLSFDYYKGNRKDFDTWSYDLVNKITGEKKTVYFSFKKEIEMKNATPKK